MAFRPVKMVLSSVQSTCAKEINSKIKRFPFTEPIPTHLAASVLLPQHYGDNSLPKEQRTFVVSYVTRSLNITSTMARLFLRESQFIQLVITSSKSCAEPNLELSFCLKNIVVFFFYDL